MKSVSTKPKNGTNTPAPLTLIREVDNLSTGEITVEKEEKQSAPVVSATIEEAGGTESIILTQCAEYVNEFFLRFQGMTDAWVRMGFALLKAKEVVPHGKFIAWREEKFPQFRKSHMSNAMQIASQLIDKQDELTRNQILRMGKKEFWEFAEQQISLINKTSTRALMMELKEMRQNNMDTAHEANCRAYFEQHPADMDRYLPEIESGEKTWAQVWMAIQGAKNSVDENGHRKETDVAMKLWEHSRKMSHFVEKLATWDAILPERRSMIIESTAKVIEVFPTETKEYLFKKLKAELGL